MIRLRIKALMKEKGIKAPFKAMVKLGIRHDDAHKYMSGIKQWIVIEHIEKLCLFLRCQPNDLFEWVPDDKLQDHPNQPLQKLKPKPPFVLDDAAKDLTPDELRELFEKRKKDEEDKKK